MARKTRAEVSIDKVLKDIETAQKQLAELRTNKALVAQKIEPMGAVSEFTEDEAKIHAGKIRFVEESEVEIERLESEIAKAWAFCAGLGEEPGRSKASDDELGSQLAALEGRQQRLLRLRGTFKEDFHDQIDAVITFHRDRIDALLASPLGAEELEELGRVWSWRDESFREALHAAIDSDDHLLGARDFAEGSRSSWQAELDLLNRQIARRRAEIELRESERQFAAAAQVREQALARLAPVAETTSQG
jgi:hypothetical protein